MEWLRAIVYGLIGGLAEFLPISSVAHEEMVLKIMGSEVNRTVLDLLTHIGMLMAVLIFCRKQFRFLHRHGKVTLRHRTDSNKKALFTVRLFRTALISIAICFLFSGKASALSDKTYFIVIFLILNGIFLFIPQYLPTGNKDALSVTRMDGFVMGLGAGLSVLPGFSSVGMVISIGSALGLNRQFALDFSFLLTVPVLLCGILGNIVDLVLSGVGTVSAVILIRYLLAAGMAFVGSYGGITMMRFLSAGTGYGWFAYYCWGAALFMLILFMTI